MTVNEFLKENILYIGPGTTIINGEYLKKEDANTLVEIAKKELAYKLLDRFDAKPDMTVHELMHYLYGIVDF